MKVKLLANRWRQRTTDGTVVHRAGAMVDVDDATAAWLMKSGAAIDPDAEPEPAPAVQEPATDAPTADDDAPGDLPPRPLNAANKAAWEDYYRAVKKSDPKGMDKAEIIAAVG